MTNSTLATATKIAGLVAGVLALAMTACGDDGSIPTVTTSGPSSTAATNPTNPLPATLTHTTPVPATSAMANVISVSISGRPGNYSLSVTVESPDTGCGSYADWWEVVSEGGELLYRRLLLHSHVDEQPFTRSGGPVDIQPGDTVIVRAHMSTTGYGGSVLRGSPADGFSTAVVSAEFASGLEDQKPLPSDCAF